MSATRMRVLNGDIIEFYDGNSATFYKIGNSSKTLTITSHAQYADLKLYAPTTSVACRMVFANDSYNYRIGLDSSNRFAVEANSSTPVIQVTSDPYLLLQPSNAGYVGLNITTPLNYLHIGGDSTNPAIRIDNGAPTTTPTSLGGRTFYGWIPISIDGTTRYIPLYN